MNMHGKHKRGQNNEENPKEIAKVKMSL